MWIRECLLFLMGMMGGIMVAAGTYAFITLLQIIQRFATESETAKHICFYEDCVMLGGVLGNIVYLFRWNLSFGWIGLGIFGLFSGIFVGCLAIALAELLDVIPTLTRRTKLKKGLKYMYLSIAVGKGIGTLYQLVLSR